MPRLTRPHPMAARSDQSGRIELPVREAPSAGQRFSESGIEQVVWSEPARSRTQINQMALVASDPKQTIPSPPLLDLLTGLGPRVLAVLAPEMEIHAGLINTVRR